MDKKKFSEFYDQNINKVFRFVYLRVDSTETAQDLTSLVFLKFWKTQASFVDNKINQSSKVSNPKAFLFQMARNQIIDFYRQKDKKPLSLDKLGEIADFQVAKPTFSQQIELDLEMERIKKALQFIKPLYADIIIWKYLDDLSNKEISQILKKKEGNVRVLLHRAMESLKKQLDS